MTSLIDIFICSLYIHSSLNRTKSVKVIEILISNLENLMTVKKGTTMNNLEEICITFLKLKTDNWGTKLVDKVSQTHISAK